MLILYSNETGKDSRRTSYVPENPGPAEPQVSAPDALSPAPVVTTPAMQTTPYYQPQTVTPLPEATTPPRYTSSQFRTPQIPSSAFNPLLRSSPSFKSISK